jgi:hypothetical protein
LQRLCYLFLDLCEKRYQSSAEDPQKPCYGTKLCRTKTQWRILLVSLFCAFSTHLLPVEGRHRTWNVHWRRIRRHLSTKTAASPDVFSAS